MRIPKRLKKKWRSIAYPVVGLLAFAALFVWRLGSWLPGLSQAESTQIAASGRLHDIYVNPIYGPYKLLELAAHRLSPANVLVARLPSVVIIAVFLGALYYLLLRWFGKTIALLATAMTAGTGWLLIAGRTVDPEVMMLLPISIGSSVMYLNKTKTKWAYTWLALSLAICLYIPGLFWLALVVGIWQRRWLKQTVIQLSWAWRLVLGVSLVVLVSPLIRAGMESHAIGREILALPSAMPHPLTFIKSLGWGILSLVWRTPYHEAWSLGQLPVLDIIQSVLVAFGVYAMWSFARSKATYLAIYAALALILEALNSDLHMLLLVLPVLLVFMGAGLRYLYFEWHGVFPYNPLPRLLAVGLISLVAIVHVMGGVRYGLFAWPGNSETKAAYHVKIK